MLNDIASVVSLKPIKASFAKYPSSTVVFALCLCSPSALSQQDVQFGCEGHGLR